MILEIFVYRCFISFWKVDLVISPLNIDNLEMAKSYYNVKLQHPDVKAIACLDFDLIIRIL